jgi:hypothetical protein
MRIKKYMPNALAVVSELYFDHVLYVAAITASLFAGGYLLTL